MRPETQETPPSAANTELASPHRAVRLKLEIEADSREDLRHALWHFDRTFDERQPPGGMSGGYSWGWIYTLAEDSGPSHDEYAAQLERWFRG